MHCLMAPIEKFSLHLGLSVAQDPTSFGLPEASEHPLVCQKPLGGGSLSSTGFRGPDSSFPSSSVINRCYLDLKQHQQQ